MTGCLYGLLGVRRTARPETIKRAFHRRAKDLHPDTGGDREAFERAHLAYVVLMDPEKRSRYDRTGEIDEGAADNALSELVGLVAWALSEVMRQISEGEGDPRRIDVVSGIRRALELRDGQMDKQISRLARERGAYSQVVGRFRVKKGARNVLADMAGAHLREIERRLGQVEAEKAKNARALAILDDYDFDFIDPAVPTVRFFSTAGTTTASWSVG